MIKPIETVYNGYRFRSRLEARWAVFFDAAGIKYQYEPEGFEYEGERYLPDFYLPNEDVYVEVKPDDDKRITEIRKAVNVCCRATGRMLVILSDIPNIQNCAYWVFNAFYYHPAEQRIIWRPVMIRPDVEEKTSWICSDYAIFREVEKNEYQIFEKGDRRLDYFPLVGVSCYTYELGEADKKLGRDPIKEDKYLFRACDLESNEEYEYLKNAYDKARQARFEFGETPEVARD